MTKGKRVYPLIILSLVFLFNPSANLIDILPDCVAYILLIVAIGGLSETVPYLAECKSALIKLAMVTLIKMPAFLVMQTNMIAGRDIVPLFTLVFVALEIVLLYSAVDNGFKALSYIGERTDCQSVREPFEAGRSATTPEALKLMTFIFFIARGALNLLPELLLLTPEDTSLRRRLSDAYPTVLVICILAALAVGIVWLYYAVKYVKTIKRSGDLADAIESISVKETPEQISAKDKLKKLTSSLTLMAASSLFIFDITISEFGGYNILPHFIYGILLFCSVYSFSSNKQIRLLAIVSSAGYSLSSLLVYLFTVRFFDTYNYIYLNYSTMARAAYLPVKIFSITEALFAVFMLTVAAIATANFIREHTDVAPDDPSYSITNEKNHRSTCRKTMPLFVISGIINLAKCVNVFIKQTSTVIYSEVNPDGISASAVPVMDTLIFLACIIYVIYSFVAVSSLKDEVKFKYGEDV